MWKFLEGNTYIPGGTSIPESIVCKRHSNIEWIIMLLQNWFELNMCSATHVAFIIMSHIGMCPFDRKKIRLADQSERQKCQCSARELCHTWNSTGATTFSFQIKCQRCIIVLQARHSLISAVSISAIFNLMRFIILSRV